MPQCFDSLGQAYPIRSRGWYDFIIKRIIFLSAVALCFLLAPVNSLNGASGEKRSVELKASKTVITFLCPPYHVSRACSTTADFQVALTATAKGFNKQSSYVYTVSGGRVLGEGSKVTWDLSETWPGVYTATVEVQDKKKRRAISSVTVTLQNCQDCVSPMPCAAPVMTCYDEVHAGTPITCKLVVGPAFRRAPWTYEWSARAYNGDASDRIDGQGTYISIRTDGLGGQTVFVTVKIKGLDPSCPHTAASSTKVKR